MTWARPDARSAERARSPSAPAMGGLSARQARARRALKGLCPRAEALFGAVDDTVLTAARPALATLGLFFICVAIWPKPGARSRAFMIAMSLVFAAQYGWWRITQTLPPATYTFEYALALG